MNSSWKIATVGVVTGITVSIASVTMADARDMGGRQGHDHMRGAQGFGGAAMSFAQMDENGDGSLTVEDMEARARARFADADADGDGSVTLAELTAAGVARFGEAYDARVAAAAPGEVPGRPSDAQVTARAEKMAQAMIRRGDADRNGTLDESEAMGGDRFARMIDRWDSDDDGAVTEAEFDAAKAERAEMRKGMRGAHGERFERGEGRARGERGAQGQLGNRPTPPAALGRAPETAPNAN
ncbi:hypothetical protein [uncultured Maritimibacter sp.]|jgi:Ca2+-binding EF-hand superfamily protein|uniref:hypothetical protein n=1 Tax=uncultured Maritimibacter sp. TaxID=991866 RepID=UPI00263345C9|nr:hypothetical protein [uncultured Maritimibacter sp.]